MRKSSEDRLLRLAKSQFKMCEDWEGAFQKTYNEDIKFANGDSDNNWQWPGELYRQRQLQQAPSLTVNQVRSLNNLIINQIKRNPPSIIVVPTGGRASVESAKMYSALVREISRYSRATNIYTRASRFQVDGGVAYWRVLTEWEDPQAFTQRIRIASLRDMMSAFLDPNAVEPDKRDAKFGFVFQDELKDKVYAEYPKLKSAGTSSNVLIEGYPGWMSQDHVRIAEWFNMEEEDDELIMVFDQDTGRDVTQYKSLIPTDLLEGILTDPRTQRRAAKRMQMMWRKIIGHTIVAEKKWPGKYVPIIQAVGDELVVEGLLERKGNTRLLKDAQRMLNYWLSAGTEHVALQTKTPYKTDLRAIEGYEQYWNNANKVNLPYLPYRAVLPDGTQLPPPTRESAPEFSQGYLTGMQMSDRQLMTISGQRDATRDMETDNLKSGKAMLVRREGGETSTFHFNDNLDIAVAHTGRVILDLVPHIYDTPRMVRAMLEDGEQIELNIDPGMEDAHREEKNKDGDEENASKVMFNPRVGSYDVEAKSGPDFTTQREYAVEAMTAVLQTNNALWGVMGDLLVKNMDFPGAQEMAERVRRTIPAAILGEGPTPDMEKLMAENQHLSQLLENFTALLSAKNLELINKDEKTAIDAMNAETKRIKELGNASADFKAMGLEGDVRELIVKAIGEALDARLPDSTRKTDEELVAEGREPAALKPTNGGAAPMLPAPRHPQGRIAPDGHEYVEHAPGKFAKVEGPVEGGVPPQ